MASAVTAGNIPKALELAETLAPGVLQAHPGVRFKLEVQTFIELVRVPNRDVESSRKCGVSPKGLSMGIRSLLSLNGFSLWGLKVGWRV